MASIVINLVERTRIKDHKIVGRLKYDGSSWTAEGEGAKVLEMIKARKLAWGPVYLDIARPDEIAELLPMILRSVYLTASVQQSPTANP